MKWVAAALWGIFSINAWAQCAPVNLLHAIDIPLVSAPDFASGLQRQPDGTWTRHRFKFRSPFSKLSTDGNFPAAFLNCTAAASHSFHLPASSALLADTVGTSSRDIVFANLVGNGTPGLVAILAGFVFGVTGTSNVVVGLSNPDVSLKTATVNPTPPAPH